MIRDDFLRMMDEWIRDGAITLDAQPVVSLRAGIPDHLEALTRIKKRPPGGFIVELEEHRLINVLDRYVIQFVCEYLSTHPESPNIFVNISGQSMSQNGRFTAYIQKQLTDFHVNPNRLGLEITERIEIGNDAPTASFLAYMKALGVAIAFDDFGIGKLTLENLSSILPKIVKIDGRFIRGLVSDNVQIARESLTDTVTMLDQAHARDALVVCEHVETETLFNIVRELGADYVQGWYTGMPSPLVI